jgi:GNAT superfamily N-acetyltransferase
MVDASRVIVRPMRSEDAASVADLTTQLGYPSTDVDISRRFELIAERSDTRLFVADENGRVVGWIHVQAASLLECDARAEIWGLVVDRASRGSGVGRRLVQAAEDWARDRGLNSIALRSNQRRTDAQAFYQHLGYTIAKTQNAFRKRLT